MIEKPTHEVLTLSTTSYDVSVSRNLFSMAEMPQFGASGNQCIWDYREPTGKREIFLRSQITKSFCFRHFNFKRKGSLKIIFQEIWDFLGSQEIPGISIEISFRGIGSNLLPLVPKAHKIWSINNVEVEGSFYWVL